ncbi:hypothetical protein D3C81_1095780 [compost metagenome]
MQQHLFIASQFPGITHQMQAVIEVHALVVVGDDLGVHFDLGVELHLVQVIEVQFEGEQRVAAGLAAVAVQAQAIHQGIGGVAENQQVEGVAQVAVVVDPVGDDGGLVGGEGGHGLTSNMCGDGTVAFASKPAPTGDRVVSDTCDQMWERACSRRGQTCWPISLRFTR